MGNVGIRLQQGKKKKNILRSIFTPNTSNSVTLSSQSDKSDANVGPCLTSSYLIPTSDFRTSIKSQIKHSYKVTARRAGTGARRPYRKHKQFSNSNSNSQFICCFPKLFRGGQLPSPSHICRPLCLHYARLIGRCMECLCARAFTCVGVCVRVSSLRRFRAIVCLCMCTPRAYVCF